MAAIVSSKIPTAGIQLKKIPKSVSLPTKLKDYKSLNLDYSVAGEANDTLLSRGMHYFLRSVGHEDKIHSDEMDSDETILKYVHAILLENIPDEGLELPENTKTDYIGGRIYARDINEMIDMPPPITSRLIHSFAMAYYDAGNDDVLVKNAIIRSKTPQEDMTVTKFYNKFPKILESRSIKAPLQGFKNILYTTFTYTGAKTYLKINHRTNIIDTAIEKAYHLLTYNLTNGASSTKPLIDTMREDDRYESPAHVFIRELIRDIGYEIAEDGTVVNPERNAMTQEKISMIFQTERGGLLALYPDMILPNYPEKGVVYAAEELGKMASSYNEAPEQGDLEIIRMEIQDLKPTTGKAGAIKDDMESIPVFFAVTKPFVPSGTNSYLYPRGGTSTKGYNLVSIYTTSSK